MARLAMARAFPPRDRSSGERFVDFAGLARLQEDLNIASYHRRNDTARYCSSHKSTLAALKVRATSARARARIENSSAVLKQRVWPSSELTRLPREPPTLLQDASGIIRIGVISIRRSITRGEFRARAEMRRANPWEDFAPRTQ